MIKCNVCVYRITVCLFSGIISRRHSSTSTHRFLSRSVSFSPIFVYLCVFFAHVTQCTKSLKTGATVRETGVFIDTGKFVCL